MTEKELKRLGRRELIEIIAVMKKRETELEARLEKAEKLLADRTIKISNAGSIAEASLSLNGVFDAAQAAADTYLQSLHAANSSLELRMTQAQKECDALLKGAEQEAVARIQAADKQCAERIAAADVEIRNKWKVFRENVQKVQQAHSELAGYLPKEPQE